MDIIFNFQNFQVISSLGIQYEQSRSVYFYWLERKKNRYIYLFFSILLSEWLLVLSYWVVIWPTWLGLNFLICFLNSSQKKRILLKLPELAGINKIDLWFNVEVLHAFYWSNLGWSNPTTRQMKKPESFQFLWEIGKISIGVFIEYGLVSQGDQADPWILVYPNLSKNILFVSLLACIMQYLFFFFTDRGKRCYI